MGAFNYLAVTTTCPVCGRMSDLSFQIHAGASFGGDDTGRFCMRSYRLGEQFAWWPESDPKHTDWAEGAASPSVADAGEITQDCYGECGTCATELLATIVFRNLRAVEVVNLRPDSNQSPKAI